LRKVQGREQTSFQTGLLRGETGQYQHPNGTGPRNENFRVLGSEASIQKPHQSDHVGSGLIFIQRLFPVLTFVASVIQQKWVIEFAE
jgi:hypothetical protein